METAVIGTGYVELVTGACLANVGYPVVCVDKNLEKLRNNIIPNALIILTEWEDFSKMRKFMKTSIIFDGRNLYNRDTLEKESFELYQIGV